jgi:tetratricopeptide (TPR) repeat protein
VFSSLKNKRIGAGQTAHKSLVKIYFYAKEDGPSDVLLRPLKANYLPMDKGLTITREELIEKYTAEPEVYAEKMLPALKKLKQAIARGERHRESGEFNAAEFEFENALDMEAENARATFGLGLTYMDWGKPDKAAEVFEKLIRMDGAFKAEHKHLFNEFGIKLRKNGMYARALNYYERALELCSDDENLHCNMARTFYDMGEPQQAARSLRLALEINPASKGAKAFLEHIEKEARTAGPRLD